MDTVTQAILGATIAQAGFKEKLGKKAVVFGAACGLFPDLDSIVRLAGRWPMIIHHRGVTHSLIVLTILTPLFGWAGYYWSKRKGDFFTWCHLAFWALITHPLLDICTSYGTQLFSPFSNRRFAIDAVAVIDLFYTVPLLIALLIGYSEKFSAKFCQRLAGAMLALTTLYLIFGYYQSRKAITIASQQLKQEQYTAKELRATPTLFNLFLWRIVARDDEGNLRLGMLSTLAPEKISFLKLKRPDHPAVKATLSSKKGKIFMWFAGDMVHFTVATEHNTTKVYLQDQRYGLISKPERTFFNACAQFDHYGTLIDVTLLSNPRDYKLTVELSEMWNLILGKKTERKK